MANDEMFPIVDDNDNVIGKASRAQCHSGSMILHPVVHLHIFSPDRKFIYLQKRSLSKDIQPGKWDTAVGGHVDFGESTIDALRREAREELGLLDFSPVHLLTYIFQSSIEREMVHAFAAFLDVSSVITPDLDEVSEGKFWCIDDVISNMGKGLFTPNFEQEFLRIKNDIFK